MNKKFIIIILLICGCFYRNQKINSNSQEFTFKVVSYNAISSDSLESNIFIKIPLKPLVFRKTEGYFESNLEISIKIKDSISESQISRFSWHEKIIEEFYNPTRSNESTYQIHKKIMLKGGQYEFIVNIKDLDSHRKWKIDKDILVSSNNNISELIPYYNDNGKIVYIDKRVPFDLDTIHIDFQLNNLIKDEIAQYSLFFKEKLILKGPISSLYNNRNSTILPINNNWNGEYDYYIVYDSDSSKFSFIFNNNNKIGLWSSNMNELIGVMNYILDYSEIQKLNSFDEDQKLSYISNYWGINNSSQSQQLLVEITNRFNYVNKEFSINDFLRGWETDRGRIYIIRGRPNKIDTKYSYDVNKNYEIWHYGAGEQFIFVEISMGDYELQ